MRAKNYWDMTKEEQEAMLAAAARKEIAEHHAAGRSTVHGDNQGVFLIHPDGTKEYIKLYDPPKVSKRIYATQRKAMDRA